MATDPSESVPLLAQVPLAELTPHLRSREPGGSLGRTEVRRRASLSRAAKRSVGLLFLGLGIMSMLALGRGVAAASSDGLNGDDIVLLVMLGIISLVVASQSLSLLRTLPGTRRIWRWAAQTRQRRRAPTLQRPLLAQVDARSLLVHMSPAPPQGAGAGRLRPVARTVGWVVLTLVIMAAATAAAAAVGLSAIRSVVALGWGLDTLLSLGMAVLIGYGVTALSIGLIRSWFERRRRRLRRMLMRLLRYLLRGFDRSTAALPRMLGRFDRRTGLLGRGVLVTVGAAVVVAASMAIPVSAVGGNETSTAGPDPGPASTSTSTTVAHLPGVEYETTPEFAVAGNPSEEGAVEAAPFRPAPTAVSDTTTTTVGDTTTTEADTTTTVPDTTTTTVGDTTTTVPDTTTTTIADTSGPTVSRVSDDPDPIFTSGNPPDTSRISATTSDPSGVATVTVYYRLGKAAFVVWGSMKPGSSSTMFGPFPTIGIYEYRIMATDTLGNVNCKTVASCPGGTVTVIIP